MNVKINGSHIGQYIHARKPNGEFKGYVLDEVVDVLKVLVTDTIKGSPKPIEYVKTKEIAGIDGIHIPVSEKDNVDTTKILNNIFIGMLSVMGLVSLGLGIYVMGTAYIMGALLVFGVGYKSKCDKCGKIL
ncbi:hypothetical protein [Virgibacillus siamensis]|uniref:hypothetical protein n=1 Tax=Virgibacillus siamensis TaxID=480071 RepID=UPI0009861915|nr:hypothetical protein [Virgibacillus siamensis]